MQSLHQDEQGYLLLLPMVRTLHWLGCCAYLLDSRFSWLGAFSWLSGTTERRAKAHDADNCRKTRAGCICFLQWFALARQYIQNIAAAKK